MSPESNIQAGMEPQPLLKVRDVSFAYGNGRAVNDVCFTLNQGEIGSIVGPSGCGKSTLLRGIAGFEQLQSGTISMNGNMLSTPEHSVAPEKRKIGMVFQDYALFPHLNVSENIAFGLRNWSSTDRSNRVSELLSLIELKEFGNRDPHSMSGGEQQRVALARAIAPKPKLLLMDEAFSSLDVEICQTLIPQVKEILKQEDIASIMVTHDHDKAFAIADKLGVMEKGCVHQWDVPFKVYHNPINRFTARFIGEGEFIPATVINEQMLKTVFGLHALSSKLDLKKDDEVELLLRPDDILHDDESPLSGEVVHKSFRGSHHLYTVRMMDGQTVFCFADSHHNHSLGERIGLSLNMEHVVIFRSDEEDASSHSSQVLSSMAETA